MRFLDLFQDNKHLGKDSLKFAKEFNMAVDHDDTTKVGTVEDWYPMGEILKWFGQSLNDFASVNDAMIAVRHLCAQNQALHGYEDKPESIDEKFPQFSRFWFVKGLGKTKEATGNVRKTLSQGVDLRNIAQLEQAKLFMEGMGWPGEQPSSSSVIENAKATELKAILESLKLS